MTTSKLSEIQAILNEVDNLLRQRLKALDLNIAHVILAMAPEGTGVLRSNVGEDELSDMAEMLAEIADGGALQRPGNEKLN